MMVSKKKYEAPKYDVVKFDSNIMTNVSLCPWYITFVIELLENQCDWEQHPGGIKWSTSWNPPGMND